MTEHEFQRFERVVKALQATLEPLELAIEETEKRGFEPSLARNVLKEAQNALAMSGFVFPDSITAKFQE